MHNTVGNLSDRQYSIPLRPQAYYIVISKVISNKVISKAESSVLPSTANQSLKIVQSLSDWILFAVACMVWLSIFWPNSYNNSENLGTGLYLILLRPVSPLVQKYSLNNYPKVTQRRALFTVACCVHFKAIQFLRW